jgi:hypothetical protein
LLSPRARPCFAVRSIGTNPKSRNRFFRRHYVAGVPHGRRRLGCSQVSRPCMGAYVAAESGRGLTMKNGVFAIDDAFGAIEAANAAAFAVSASTYSADEATFAVSAATSAARALATGDSSTNAADAFWFAVSIDASRIEEGIAASVMAGTQLWPNGPPPMSHGQPAQLGSLWQAPPAALWPFFHSV